MEELTFFQKLLSDPSAWALLVVIILFVIREKNFFFGLINKGQQQREKEKQAELTFESQIRAQTLEASEWSKELVGEILNMLRDEQLERKSVTQQLVDQTKSAEAIVQSSIEVMKEFADIARLQGTRQDMRDEELRIVLEATEKVLSAVWFVLVDAYKVKHTEEAATLVSEVEKKYGNGTADRPD